MARLCPPQVPDHRHADVQQVDPHPDVSVLGLGGLHGTYCRPLQCVCVRVCVCVCVCVFVLATRRQLVHEGHVHGTAFGGGRTTGGLPLPLSSTL